MPADGSQVWYHQNGAAWKTGEGAIAHVIKVDDPAARADHESYMPTGTQVGLSDQQRGHTIGAGFGAESPYAILLEHQAVNLILKNQEVEEEIRGLQKTKSPSEDLFLITETDARPSQVNSPEGLTLREVVYELYALPKQKTGDLSFQEMAQERPDVRPEEWVKRGQPVCWATIELGGDPAKPTFDFKEGYGSRSRG